MVEYVDELPPAAEKPEEKWQLAYNRHTAWKKKLKPRAIRPLTIVVTQKITDAERVAEELQDFLKEWEGLTSDQATAKVLCVTSAAKHQPNVAKLRVVDSPASKVEWIVSVSMLSEGWDIGKNIFRSFRTKSVPSIANSSSPKCWAADCAALMIGKGKSRSSQCSTTTHGRTGSSILLTKYWRSNVASRRRSIPHHHTILNFITSTTHVTRT